MYNVMVVDDDYLVRQRVISSIESMNLELRICAEAETGTMALELFEQYHPQIVIMDINIPQINGIDVAKTMIRNNEDISIVIITGFGTIDFAKEAIRNGMVDFLLKPINQDELAETLQHIKTNLEKKALLAIEQQNMKKLLERSMPLLRNKYFMSLINTTSEELNEEECRLYLKDFGIDGPITDIVTVIIVPKYHSSIVSEKMTIQGILEEELKKNLCNTGECFQEIVVFDSTQRAILIVYGSQDNLEYCLEKKLEAIRDRLRYIYKIDFRASIGKRVDEFRNLNDSYHSAEYALDYWNVFGENNVVSSRNIQQVVKDSQNQNESIRHSEIMDLFVSQSEEEMTQRLNEYMSGIVVNSQNSAEIVRQRLIELIALMISGARELGIVIDTTANQNPYYEIFQTSHISEMRQTVLRLGDQIYSAIGCTREQNYSKTVGDAKRYIIQNYMDVELSLSKVAENVHISPGYLSQLIKKQTGTGFTDYLNYIRIEHAKQLLSTTDLRVYEVSEAVGYQNSKYFYQVFKQLTGKRPREFSKETAE